jgi:ASC-1-like (ASCH) protein
MSTEKNVIAIRLAVESDFLFIESLMNLALNPYYEGDHCAHAQRIFKSHIAGGDDAVGQFSLNQRMFIITVDEKPAGMIHLVGKKQGNFKISPLIISPGFKGKIGLGSRLLSFAEDYVQKKSCRQLYCTVAKNNHEAYKFFLGKGFVVAGQAESHYKDGVTEVMMYKLFDSDDFLTRFDQEVVSVVPLEMDSKFRVGAEKLILEKLPNFFGGVNQDWVDALFKGHGRRFSGDVNEKYKIIYVAIDKDDNVVGVVGATPKKGQPIKLMPIVVSSFPAFIAIISEIPFLLKEYGRKLYLHSVPTVQQTIALQKFGWSLDALMPAAYKNDVVTQQWSFKFGDDCIRGIRTKKEFFESIKIGKKKLEVRVGYDSMNKIVSGERVKIFSYDSFEVVKIGAIRKYDSFLMALKSENHDLIIPGRSKEDVLAFLRVIYPPHKESLGVLVFEIETE